MPVNKWDIRFSGDEFFYGEKPNRFFAVYLDGLNERGKLLLPAEGEGRNAVYAAKKGWHVDAFDSSSVARQKALGFAARKKVAINYTLLDVSNFAPEPQTYDLIALVFLHLPEGMRKRFHRQVIESLKPGGRVLIESFEKKQIHNHSGGPPDVNLLYSKKILEEDFAGLNIIDLFEAHEHLNEGHHHGPADLVRMIGKKAV